MPPTPVSNRASTALDSACGCAPRGRVKKAGRTISVVDGEAFEHEAGSHERKRVATMTATIMTITGRDDVRH
ncbi:MAG TPA: hypothetical protein VNU48_02185 [Burkholderiaceae bacterium]|nr:hypothetical protein [Burkholderiaceae bacterium]